MPIKGEYSRNPITTFDTMVRTRLLCPFYCLLAALALFACRACAHTLPISYLRLQADADYLHLELVFNAFEISFISELDDNKDGELDEAELMAHGQALANRVVSVLKLTVGGKPVFAETAGMDPDMTGHHVRLRAHYKVDARRLPVTLESDLNSITSSSHLIQVAFVGEGPQQLAQLDMHWPKVTFQPPVVAASQPGLVTVVKVAKTKPVTFQAVMPLALLLLLAVGLTVLLMMNKPPLPNVTPVWSDRKAKL